MHRKDFMERVLQYMIAHLNEDLRVAAVAHEFNYSSAYFSKLFFDYFEIPFMRFFRSMKLRGAAREILQNQSIKGIREKWGGYSNAMSFCKAFRKEFGMSPKDFLRYADDVPDMPARKRLDGDELTIEYVFLDEIKTASYSLYHYNYYDNEPDFWKKEFAYGLFHGVDKEKWKDFNPQIGFWWNKTAEVMNYAVGRQLDYQDKIPKGMDIFVFPAGSYVMFSTKRKETDIENAKLLRKMSQFIFFEWKIINQKKFDIMRSTFEWCDRETVKIYVPIILETNTWKTSYGVDTWIRYINNHIDEELTITKLADIFGYSRTSFRQVFQLHYEMDPAVYIRRKRLYFTAQEIEQEVRKEKQILIYQKYNFKSKEEFIDLYIEEFGISPFGKEKIKVEVVDLKQYYDQYKACMKITYSELNDIKFLGKTVMPQTTMWSEEYKISSLAAYWFLNDFDSMLGKDCACKEVGQENKVAIWKQCPQQMDTDELYEYVLGPVVDEFHSDWNEGSPFLIRGGRYAVFETMQETDEDNLEEMYLLLTRCAFYGWCKENIDRYDSNRIVFAWYKNKKLYFYIPIFR